MLCLGLGRFKWAGEDANVGVFQLLVHLGMTEATVQNDTFHKAGVLQTATNLCLRSVLIQWDGRHTTNLMRSKRTSFLSKSATFRTASTAIVAIFFLKLHDHSNNTTSYLLTILELSVVIAVSMRASGFSFVNVIVSAMVLRYSTAILQAYTVNDDENQILVRNHQQF